VTVFAAVATVTATAFLVAPTASASEHVGATESNRQAPVACDLEAYVDTHNGQVWGTGYTTPVSCHPQGTLYGQLERDGALVARGEQACFGASTCTVSTNSIGLGSGRHLWCSRVTFYASGTDPVANEYGCRYIPA
jgi:hypothetical protein